MPLFRATDVEGNTTEYDEPTPRSEHFAAGWRLEEIVIAVAAPDAPPVEDDLRTYDGRRELSRIEFLRMFTAAERITLRTVAESNPALADYLDLIDKAESISLDDADVIAGLTMLEQAGLLAAGRAEEILNG